MTEDTMALPCGTGLSSLRDEADDASSPEASIPSAGDWVIIRNWGLVIRQIDKITPTLYKLGAGSQRHPTQIRRGDRTIVCCVPTREIAEHLVQSIGGIDGEYRRRKQSADDDRDTRVAQAVEARDKQVARAVASAIEARRAETQSGSVHESAAPQEGAK